MNEVIIIGLILIIWGIFFLIEKRKKDNKKCNHDFYEDRSEIMKKRNSFFKILDDQKKIDRELLCIRTNELLEILIVLNKSSNNLQKATEILNELDELKVIYSNIIDQHYHSIEQTINEKINIKIIRCNNQREKLLSLLDELKYCRKRFYQFNHYLNSNIIKVENKLEEM